METAIVICCRSLIDAIMAGNKDPQDQLRRCALCSQPVVIASFGQAREAGAKRDNRACYTVCNPCAMHIIKEKKTAGGDVELQASPATIAATERSETAKQTFHAMLRAIFPR
jgi:hypothetical protein